MRVMKRSVIIEITVLYTKDRHVGGNILARD